MSGRVMLSVVGVGRDSSMKILTMVWGAMVPVTVGVGQLVPGCAPLSPVAPRSMPGTPDVAVSTVQLASARVESV